jgi:tetratricopeptide (TPR) repeat protein
MGCFREVFMIRSGCRVLAAVVALASSVYAQDWKGSGRLEGKVLDAQGAPIVGASVKLARDQYGDGTTLKTDKKGRWAIAGITAATWNADIEAEGYAPKKISIPLPSESTRLPPVQVRLDKAVAAGPPPEVLQALEKGEAAYKAGRFPEARAEFEKLLALRPDLATTIHQRIGFAYIQEKDYAKGLEHLQKVLDADPGNTVVRGIMAQAALEGGMLDRGMELLKGLDEATVKNPDVFFNIGVGFRNKDKPDAAISYFSKAIAVDPAYVDGYFQRGLTYFGLQKLPEAKADFQKVVDLAPDSPQAAAAKKVLEQLK